MRDFLSLLTYAVSFSPVVVLIKSIFAVYAYDNSRPRNFYSHSFCQLGRLVRAVIKNEVLGSCLLLSLQNFSSLQLIIISHY